LTLLFPYHPLRDYYDLTCDEYQQTQQEQPKKLILSKLVNNLWTKLKKGAKGEYTKKIVTNPKITDARSKISLGLLL
jgi:hypothetical protein